MLLRLRVTKIIIQLCGYESTIFRILQYEKRTNFRFPVTCRYIATIQIKNCKFSVYSMKRDGWIRITGSKSYHLYVPFKPWNPWFHWVFGGIECQKSYMFSPSVLPKIRGVFRGSDVEINTEGYRSGHNGADSKSVWVQAHVGSNPILSANFCKKVSISPGTFFELKCQDISQKHVRFLSFFHFNHNLIISLPN